uniref:Adenylyl cyclase-associated protein n=1 Tax=Lygus hesperus TaxID=30085 RepID=A0A0A9WZN9_LYGHE
MKTKNQKDRASVVPTKQQTVKPSSVKIEIKGSPIFENKGNNWFIENQQKLNAPLEIKDLKMQNAVYIGTSCGIAVRVTGKPKSISLNHCEGVSVYVENVLSTVEVTNCERCSIFITKSCPTVAIDKSKGVIVNLSSDAVTTPPDLVTSNISECNLQMPGESEDQDILEIPLPEQYLTKYVNRALVTTTIKHG